MSTFYATFGLGSVLGHNYLIVYAHNMDDAREGLHQSKLPWAFVYPQSDYDRAIARHDLQPLARALEVLRGLDGPNSSHLSIGPCRIKEPEAGE